MSTTLRQAIYGHLGDLRHEPTDKRVRALLGDEVVADTTRALLVWEPRRVVPSYAVPVGDVRAELVPVAPLEEADDDVGLRLPAVSDRPVLDPSIPFQVHTAAGSPVEVRAPGGRSTGPGFRPTDPDLAEHVVLDFASFDWLEEDEPIVGHPRDPFHRIDAIRSSRSVRIGLDGHVLAESTRATMLFETMLPIRFYLPPEDVHVELQPSSTRTWCAYKGEASYWSAALPSRTVPDIAWGYGSPLHDAIGVSGLVAFFDERLDVVLDGQPRDRPVTPWS
jgi:uncharacterized protein (DUF427 family)